MEPALWAAVDAIRLPGTELSTIAAFWTLAECRVILRPAICDLVFMEPALWAAVDAIRFPRTELIPCAAFCTLADVQSYCDQPFVTEHSWKSSVMGCC